MAYDFLFYSPGTDILPVDYSWLDKKRIKVFDINSYRFVFRDWEFIFDDDELNRNIRIVASKGKLRQIFKTNYEQAFANPYKKFFWPVDYKEYIWEKPSVQWMVKDYIIKTFIYNIKKHFDIVLGRGEMNNESETRY